MWYFILHKHMMEYIHLFATNYCSSGSNNYNNNNNYYCCYSIVTINVIVIVLVVHNDLCNIFITNTMYIK